MGTSANLSWSENRDGMRIDWDTPIPMDDGIVLRADVFRPISADRCPVILSYGPYGKGLAFQEGYAPQWEKLIEDYPEVAEGSTTKYANWEVVDPEKWVPLGYACVRVDSRGAGRSPGYLDLWGPRETQDLYECIEWAAAQPWSSGKVGLCGISYYAQNQYQVAALEPPHLAAIVAWEGSSDWYREFAYHGGILCDFAAKWYPTQITRVQHGYGARGSRSRVTGRLVAGPETLSDEELVRNRADFVGEIKRRPLIDDWYLDRNPDWSRVRVPMLSAGNWGGQNLHLRGNVEAFLRAATDQKWLEIHGGAHWTHFYTNYGLRLQRRFLDHFLKGEDNDWKDQAPVTLQIRHVPERYTERRAEAWPLPDTQWTKFYLDAGGMALTSEPPPTESAVTYEADGDGLTFSTPPLTQTTEITGPIAAKLFIGSSTSDADLFLIVRAFDSEGAEVTFQGALDPNTPVSVGWLRASHRRLDPERSKPYQPWHTHDRVEPLIPGETYELDIEIWPSCVVLPPGYRVVLTVRGSDYVYSGEVTEFAQRFHYANHGVGPFTHEDPDARPSSIYGGTVTVHTGGRRASYVLLPIIGGR